MTATPLQALARARNQSVNGPRFDLGFCLRETRKLYDVPARYDSAAAAWARTRHRVPAHQAPAGSLVWWTGGNGGFGHVAVAIGDGYCWSVDIRRHGYFDRVPIGEITREWGLTLAGYSLDLNDVQVVPPPAKPTPNLDHALEDLRTARDGQRRGTRKRRRIRDLIVQLRDVRERIRR